MLRSLTGKLGISIGLYLLILIGVSAYALSGIGNLRRDVDFLGDGVLLTVQRSGEYRSAIIRAAGEASVFAATGDDDEYDEALEALELAETSLAYPDIILSGAAHHHEGHVETATSLYDERRHLHEELEGLIGALATADETERERITAAIEEWEDEYTSVEAEVDELLTQEIAMTMADVSYQQNAAFASVAVLLAVCAFFSAAILIGVQRLVAEPLKKLSAMTARVARGDFSHQTSMTRTDEVGELQQNFNTMTMTLAQQAAAMTQQIQDLEAARSTAEAAQVEAANRLATIEAQRDLMREMSVPVLPVNRDTLVMPLVGALDEERLAQIQDQALNRIEATRARRLLLDITGVPMVDTRIAQGLIQVVQAARMLGSEVTLVGIRPEVAQSIVGLGVNLGGIRVHRDLHGALSSNGAS